MTTRPPLPLQHWNQHIKVILKASVLPQVKYQILSCQGQDILVGRLKIETPTSAGHAFILRRYDTGAVSLTTMFRAAFPNALDADEKVELQWVKDNHNLAGNNGSSREPHITRLAGTWVSPTLALELGRAYEMGALIQQVVDAVPDPNANYRRSGKGQKDQDASDTPKQPSKTVTNLPTPSPTTTVAAPNPTKRRKEGSPTPAAPAPSSSPNNKPPPRRSTRTKSPPPKTKPPSSIMNAVASAATTSTTTTTKPKSSRSTKRSESMVEPPAIDQEARAVAEAAAQELYEQDMAEQKEMLKSLSSTRSPAEKPKSGKGKAASKASKRVREEEEKLQFDFKEPEHGDRAIATNKRVGLLQEPRRKSAAWGLGLFVFGAGAITLLPNFF